MILTEENSFAFSARIKTSTLKSNSYQAYKEKSKSREKKKDYSEQRRKKREFE